LRTRSFRVQGTPLHIRAPTSWGGAPIMPACWSRARGRGAERSAARLLYAPPHTLRGGVTPPPPRGRAPMSDARRPPPHTMGMRRVVGGRGVSGGGAAADRAALRTGTGRAEVSRTMGRAPRGASPIYRRETKTRAVMRQVQARRLVRRRHVVLPIVREVWGLGNAQRRLR